MYWKTVAAPGRILFAYNEKVEFSWTIVADQKGEPLCEESMSELAIRITAYIHVYPIAPTYRDRIPADTQSNSCVAAEETEGTSTRHKKSTSCS